MTNPNITVAQFLLISKYFPKVKLTRPRKYSNYELFNALIYTLRTGCQWRNIPTYYPPWQSVYQFYRKLVFGKYVDEILYRLNYMILKKKPLKLIISHVLVTDSQSVRSSECLNSKFKGYDGNKKVKGIKRFILVDTSGNVWYTHTSPANTSEREGLKQMLIKFTSMQAFPKGFKSLLADKGFEGKEFTKEILKETNITLYAMRSTKRLKKNTIYDYKQNNLHNHLNKQISKIRWVVERAFAHLDKARRLIVNYERLTKFHEGFVKLASIRLLLRKLA